MHLKIQFSFFFEDFLTSPEPESNSVVVFPCQIPTSYRRAKLS